MQNQCYSGYIKILPNPNACMNIYTCIHISIPWWGSHNSIISSRLWIDNDAWYVIRHHIISTISHHIWDPWFIHSSPKVMAVFWFLIFENFSIGGMFSILETISLGRSTTFSQNKKWCQMNNPMCTAFQMWQNLIFQNQVCFETLIRFSKIYCIFVKISIPRNWHPLLHFWHVLW